MIFKETMKQVVIQQKKWLERREETVEREILSEILKWFEDERILVLTGMRRVGKSTLLRQIMEKRQSWAYVNFEDERFLGFEAKDFENLNEILHEEYGNPDTYLFDEIQNVPDFEAFVRRLYDSGKKLVITGSNASLLSGELGSRLTGRYRAFEIFPFSFREFLRFRGKSCGKDDLYITERKAELMKVLGEYLVIGGVPEYLKNMDPEYIKTLYDNIIYRDIISRYGIKRQKILKELVNILASSISCQFTYNSLKKDLGLGNSITVKEYISYLSRAYMFFEVQRFQYSIRKQMNSPKKIYMIDPAFNQIAGFSFSPNRGRLLENLVFLELKRRKNEVYYYSRKRECDFITMKGKKITNIMQVSYEITEKNRNREIEGVVEAAKSFGIENGTVLTYDHEEETVEKGVRIEFVPLLRWLLNPKD